MKSSAPSKDPDKDGAKVLSTKVEQPTTPTTPKVAEQRDGNCYWYVIDFKLNRQNQGLARTIMLLIYSTFYKLKI